MSKKISDVKTWQVVIILAVIVIGLCVVFNKIDNSAPPSDQTTAPDTEETTPEETTEETSEVEGKYGKIAHGELLSVTENKYDNIIVVKAKIQPSYDDHATVTQNFINVVDMVTSGVLDGYDTIDYWAVADMTDGSEQKVVSFTLTSDIIKIIKEADRFPSTLLNDYNIDLWVHLSLRDWNEEKE